MVIVRLMGGIGNQLFQYSFGLNLSLLKKVPLKLDLSDFSSDQVRSYRLFHLNTTAEIATERDIRLITKRQLPRFVYKVWLTYQQQLPYFRRAVIYQKNRLFDKNLLLCPMNVYLIGYWQSEKYFENISSRLKKEFSLAKTNITDVPYYSEIKSSNSVSIHIRRGDYVSNEKFRQVHGVCSIEYYQKSVQEISKRISNPRFFVFTDDFVWARENLKSIKPLFFIETQDEDSDVLDLHLMAKCKHNIIANSSFSWWGAWLNNNPNKTVIAPKKWFADETRNINDIVPNNWIKI